MTEPMRRYPAEEDHLDKQDRPKNKRQRRLLILATFSLGSVVMVLGLLDAAANFLKFVTAPVLLGFGGALIGMALGKREAP